MPVVSVLQVVISVLQVVIAYTDRIACCAMSWQTLRAKASDENEEQAGKHNES